MKFKYNESILENNQIDIINTNKYLNPKNYIILPTHNTEELKFKLITEYNIISKFNRDSPYSNCVELLDNKFAMENEGTINIYNNESFDILFSINIVLSIDGENYISSLFRLSNGNLMCSTYFGKIFIFKINEKSYKKILDFQAQNNIITTFELHNKKIIIITEDTYLYIYNYLQKLNKYELQTKIKLNIEFNYLYKAKIIDCNDSKNIMLVVNKNMGYFNYKKGIYQLRFCKNSRYGYNIAFFKNYLIIEVNDKIYIKDRKTLEVISSYEFKDDIFLDIEVYVLKDDTFLIALCQKYIMYLMHFAYINNTIVNISELSFEEVKNDNFCFILQLKNGNIIYSITTGEYAMLK